METNGARRGLVIIPAYNEEQNLPGLLRRLRQLYPQLEVLVVNDGSTDRTSEVALQHPVRLLALPCNLGVGGAVQAGLMVAWQEHYDFAIQMDGDGQHRPEDIAGLLAALDRSGSDMVVGSRFLATAGYQSTAARRVGIRFFSRLLSALCRTPITDATSGFRIWNRRAIAVLAQHYPEDYPEVEAILLLHRAGLRISEVSVNMRGRAAGASSIGWMAAFSYMIKTPLAILMSLLRKREPGPSREEAM
ncbi:MAG TPA: glycosyltransferase family 2 protein [Terriglobia bacterium]|nr:glycosyltransferase family 2 protein [Terriglobia bacterium]